MSAGEVFEERRLEEEPPVTLCLHDMGVFHLTFTLRNTTDWDASVEFTFCSLPISIHARAQETSTFSMQAAGEDLAWRTIDNDGSPLFQDVLEVYSALVANRPVLPAIELGRQAYSFMLRVRGFRGGLINGVGGAGRSYVHQVLGQALDLPYVWPLDKVTDITTFRDVQGLISSFHIMPTLYSMIQILPHTLLRDIGELVHQGLVAGFHCSRHPLDAWISWYTLDLQLRSMQPRDRGNYLYEGQHIGIARLQDGLDAYLTDHWAHFEAVFRDAPGGNIVGFGRYLDADRFFYGRREWRVIRFADVATCPLPYFQEILASSGFRNRADRLVASEVPLPRAPAAERWRDLAPVNRTRLIGLVDPDMRKVIAEMDYTL